MTQFLKLSWLLIAATAFCNCIGTILLKQSRLTPTDSSIILTIVSPWLITSLIFYSTGLILFAKALERLPVSIAVPTCQGIGFVLTAFLSHWLFQEKLALNHIIAISFIFAAICIMTRS